MEARVDYVTSRLEEDEEPSLYCIVCGLYKPRSQMGSFNCLDCETELAEQDQAVENHIQLFDYILQKEGNNGRIRVSRVGSSADDDDTGSPRISYGPLFD